MTDRVVADQIPPGGEPLPDPRWEPWTPAEVAHRLRAVDAPWAFAAGWALDLFRGSVSRDHEDVELAVPIAGFAAVQQALRPYEFDLVGGGQKWAISDHRAFVLTHQTWLRDPATGVYVLDVFREPHDGDVWICRRDTSIRLPYSEAVRRTAGGLPYLAPEIVLLFKAKLSRPKDEDDLNGVLPLLDAHAIGWLRQALEMVHPGHAWIARVAGSSGLSGQTAPQDPG
jgi:aminoglycoside-2''-adenylyltransferase